MRKANKRYFNLIFSLIISILMSGMTSLCVTIYQLGFVDEVLTRFLGAWGISLPFAFVISQFATPLAHKIAEACVEN